MSETRIPPPLLNPSDKIQPGAPDEMLAAMKHLRAEFGHRDNDDCPDGSGHKQWEWHFVFNQSDLGIVLFRLTKWAVEADKVGGGQLFLEVASILFDFKQRVIVEGSNYGLNDAVVLVLSPWSPECGMCQRF